jgi:hypothetical protein
MLRPHRAALIGLLAVFVVLLTALAFLPPQALTHHDEGAKYLQVRNLRITGQGLDWSINYPARRYDPGLEFVPFHPKQHYLDSQGRIYLQWPIFLGLMTRIFWKVLGFAGLYVVPFAAGLASLLAAYALALAVGVPRRAAWLVVPLLGLATPVALYSLLYFEHTLAALLVALSVLAAVLSLRQTRRFAALSGALLAVAVYFRSELYVLALVLFAVLAATAWTRRDAGRWWVLPLVWLGAFALALVPLWAFYAVTEGNLLPTHALWYFAGGDPASTAGGVPKPGLPPLRYIATAGWGVIPAFLFGPSGVSLAPVFPGWVEWSGLLGAALCALSAPISLLSRLMGRRKAVSTRSAEYLPFASMGAGMILLLVTCAYTLLSRQAYYNLHGFLLASPFIALALWPASPNPAGDGVAPASFLRRVALLYAGLHALIISALSGLGPISLHEWGQRYLLPAYPLLVVLALLGACDLLGTTARMVSGPSESSRPALVRPALGVLFALLALVGLGFTARGYVVLSDERAQVVSWLQLERTLPPSEPIVTDTWWLPLNLAADFYSRPFMLASGDAKLEAWAAQMRAKGVTTFGLMTSDPAVFHSAWRGAVSGLQAVGEPRQSRGIWLQSYSLSP